MIDRYSLAVSPEVLGNFFAVDPHGFDKSRYNAAPAQLLPIITLGSQGLSHFYWGTAPQWSKGKAIGEKIINVRAEAIAERPTIRKTLKKYRCIIPADGFYGWKKISKKGVVPYRFVLKNKGLFAIAGLWEEYDDENGDMIHTFTMITVPANASVLTVMDRMPAILSREAEKQWMSEEATEDSLEKLLQPFDDVLDSYTVSPAIGDPERDHHSMIIPTAASDQFGNLTLFS